MCAYDVRLGSAVRRRAPAAVARKLVHIPPVRRARREQARVGTLGRAGDAAALGVVAQFLRCERHQLNPVGRGSPINFHCQVVIAACGGSVSEPFKRAMSRRAVLERSAARYDCAGGVKQI